MSKWEIIAATNQKSCVGKTTTTENVDIGLVENENAVLIDGFDPQGIFIPA